jgi:hypothetical protein
MLPHLDDIINIAKKTVVYFHRNQQVEKYSKRNGLVIVNKGFVNKTSRNG